MSALGALSYLAWRALVAHPVKMLSRRGSGLDRFEAAYFGEGLVPTLPAERALREEAAACIACGLCESACELPGAAPAIRALGLPAAFRLYSRSSAMLPRAREALEACAGCAGCEALCPTGVPVSRIVAALREAAGRGVPSPVPPWYPPAP